MKKLFTLLTMLIVAISTSWADNYTETYTNPTSSNPPARANGMGAFTVITLGTGDIQWGNSSLNIKTNGGTGTFTVSTLDGSTISEIRFTQASSYPASSITSEDGKVAGPVGNVWTYTPNTAKTSASFSMISASGKKARIAPIAIDITSNYEYLSKNFTVTSGVVSCTSSNASSDLTLTSNGSASNNGLSVGSGKTLTITSAGHNIKSIHFTYESHNNVTYSANTGTCSVNSWSATDDTKTVTFTSFGSSVIVGMSVELEEASSAPSISAENVDIEATATGGNIAFTVNNPVEGGAISAAKQGEADWLTVGTETTSPISFTASANTGAERSATVRLTYTYTEDETEKTVTKDVTITQAAAKYAITYNKGAYGTGTIAAGEKSYGVDFTLSSSTFSREGYAQTGWATTDGGEKDYDLGGTYTANAAIELFPVWTASYTYTADFSDYTKGVPAGWSFSYDSTNKFATSNGNTSTTDFVGTMKDNGQTTPSSQASINDNWVAFGKKDGGNTNYAYAILDLGVTTTVYGMNATLYFGSGSNVSENIEYLGEDGTTVKKTYNNTLSNTNWSANNISKTEAVADVRYIKVYGSNKWIIMSAFSVTTADETVLGAKVKTNGAGWTSYTPTQNATVATGAKAYIITAISGTTATTTEVTTMKAGEGYFIKGAANTEYVVTYTDANADDVTGSLLRGCLNATNLAANTTPYNYVLGTQTVNEVKKAGLFYVKTNAVIVPSSKCYLASAILENPQNLSIEFDEATAVEAIAEANANSATPVKVIKNGKLFIGNYNVAGQQVK